MSDELKLEFGNSNFFETSKPLDLKIAEPGPWRRLEFRAGKDGPTKCASCGFFAVTDTFQQSTFPGEPAEKLIGQKCHWCGGYSEAHSS